jgi:MFS family permease
VVAAQIGGRMLDRGGAKRPVVLGCVIAAVGYFLWANRVTRLDEGSLIWCIILAGAGMGLMLGQSNTDAVNRVSRLKYGEATGITQTVRNYGASLGFAILGTIFTAVLQNRMKDSLIQQGVPARQAAQQAVHNSGLGGGVSGSGSAIPQFVRLDYAEAIKSVLYTMSGIMALAFVIAVLSLRRGVQTESAGEPADLEER